MINKYILSFFLLGLIGCKSNEKHINKLIVGGSNNYISDTTIFKIIDKGNVIERGNEGKFVFLTKEKPYGFTSECLVAKNQYVHVLLRSYCYVSSINLACETSWGKWYGNSARFSINKFGWANQHLYVKVPDTISTGKLRIYAYYFGGGDGAEINRMEIRILDSSPFKNGINDYCFMPLCTDILKELKKLNIVSDSNSFVKNAASLDDKIFENSSLTKKEFLEECERRKKEIGNPKLFENIKAFSKQYPELL